MAAEGKGTKRKALAAALPTTSDAGKNKKSKPSKVSTAAKAPIEPEPESQPEVAASVKSGKSKALKKPKSKPAQKRPLDDVESGNEDGGVTLGKLPGNPDAPVGKKAKNGGKKGKVQEQEPASTEDVNGAKEPASKEPASKKKKGPQDVNLHAEKIKKLLGQKDGPAELPEATVKTKKAKGGKDDTAEEQTVEQERGDGDLDDDDIDQARNLLQGFDSDNEDPADDEGFDKDAAVSGLPHYKKTQKKLRNAAKGGKDGPGVVYVGRIPHGFYENEMRQYFSQFGTITRLRLSRNRKTGQSKHFAFLEFESLEVAKIVAETMDSYLMFGHILKCKFVEQDTLHPETFKGANKKFRVAPYNKMEKRALEAPKTESQWTKKNERELARRAKKAEQMKEMGYEYQAPELKNPSEVLEEAVLANADAGNADLEVNGAGDKTGKGVKSAKAKSKKKTEKPAPDTESHETPLENGEGQPASNLEAVPSKKQKNMKRSKKAADLEANVETDEVEQPAPPKSKKKKAQKAVSSD